MLSAVKLCQSSSISGPVATVKPRSAKISASSSITWLTGCTEPRGASAAGSVISSVSFASWASSAAFSSASFLAAMASATSPRTAWIAGAASARSSGLIPPSVFKARLTQPFFPSAATRCSSSASRVSAPAIALSAASFCDVSSVMVFAFLIQAGALAGNGRYSNLDIPASDHANSQTVIIPGDQASAQASPTRARGLRQRNRGSGAPAGHRCLGSSS